MYFLLSYGMSGGFNDVYPKNICEFDNVDQALNLSHEFAIEDYQSYEGQHGVMSYEEICEENGVDEDSDEADSYYNEEMDSWINYEAFEVKKNNDGDWIYVEGEELVDMNGVSVDI